MTPTVLKDQEATTVLLIHKVALELHCAREVPSVQFNQDSGLPACLLTCRWREHLESDLTSTVVGDQDTVHVWVLVKLRLAVGIRVSLFYDGERTHSDVLFRYFCCGNRNPATGYPRRLAGSFCASTAACTGAGTCIPAGAGSSSGTSHWWHMAATVSPFLQEAMHLRYGGAFPRRRRQSSNKFVPLHAAEVRKYQPMELRQKLLEACLVQLLC